MNHTTTSNPLNKIIGLSVVLSMGFLLVILAGINGNWFPIVDGIIFAVAYLPVAVTKGGNEYDFSFDTNSNHVSVAKELGQWISAFLVVSGVYLPIMLRRSHILTKTAMVLTIIGGVLIYGTVYTFLTYFDEVEEDETLQDMGGGVI